MPDLDQVLAPPPPGPGAQSVLEGELVVRSEGRFVRVDDRDALWGPVVGGGDSVDGDDVVIALSQSSTPYVVYPASGAGRTGRDGRDGLDRRTGAPWRAGREGGHGASGTPGERGSARPCGSHGPPGRQGRHRRDGRDGVRERRARDDSGLGAQDAAERMGHR
jgi:hypothetical protein